LKLFVEFLKEKNISLPFTAGAFADYFRNVSLIIKPTQKIMINVSYEMRGLKIKKIYYSPLVHGPGLN